MVYKAHRGNLEIVQLWNHRQTYSLTDTLQCLQFFTSSPDNVFLVSVQGISNTRVISDFHSKSPDLVTIIFDLSKVTVPEE